MTRGGRSRGQGSDGTDTEGAGRRGGTSYLQAHPRLVEAHDDSTVVHPTGASRSAPGTLPGPKLPHSQSLTGEGQGGRKRAASDTGSSTSSSRSGNSVKANHKSTSAKVVLAKRRQQSGRQGNVLERHRHHSVSGVPGDGAHRAGAREEAPRYYRTGEQVQEVDGQRDGKRLMTRSLPTHGSTYRRG